MSDAACPLCGAPHAVPPILLHARRYHDCRRCGLLHLDPSDRLTPAAERAHYTTHHNNPHDAGYRAFLDRLALPLMARLAPGAEGLDYGSGPGPTLSVMLGERGFPTTDYDPCFAPDPAPLARSYDFITCTETAEHFHAPAQEFTRLAALLRPGGILAIMTELVRADRPLAEWRYLRDPTHVSLYRRKTFVWVAEQWSWGLDGPADNVMLFSAARR